MEQERKACRPVQDVSRLRIEKNRLPVARKSTNKADCSPLQALTIAPDFCIITVSPPAHHDLKSPQSYNPSLRIAPCVRWREPNRVMKAKIPLALEPQPEGGYTVTSPLPAGADNRGRHHCRGLGQRGGRLWRGLWRYTRTEAVHCRRASIRKMRTVPCPSRRSSPCREIQGGPPASQRTWGVTRFQGEAEVFTEDGSIRDLKTGTLRAAIRQLDPDWEEFQRAQDPREKVRDSVATAKQTLRPSRHAKPSFSNPSRNAGSRWARILHGRFEAAG